MERDIKLFLSKISIPFLSVSSQSGEYMSRQAGSERKKGIIAITYFIRVAQSSAYGWELTMGMFCKNVFMMKSNCGSNWTCLPANIITAGLFQRIYTRRRLRTFSCQYFSYCASLRDALSYKHMTPRHNLPIVVHLIYVFCFIWHAHIFYGYAHREM